MMKQKKHTLRRPLPLFSVVCCCLAALLLAIFLCANDSPHAAETHSAYLSGSAETKADFQDDSTATAPRNDHQTAWYLVLVNKSNHIPENHEAELAKLDNGQLVDSRIYPALQKMFDAARSDGVYPVVASGYRTAENQQRLLDDKIAEFKADGFSARASAAKAEMWVAIPGTSEHQLGIAVDINADGVHSTGVQVYEWLARNAYRFGFILRYPSDKTEITGVAYEPWHYRYVGIEVAFEIQNQDICLEEYLNKTN